MNEYTPSKLELAQDHWLQVMTVQQRLEVMQIVPRKSSKESGAKWHSRLLEYVSTNILTNN